MPAFSPKMLRSAREALGIRTAKAGFGTTRLHGAWELPDPPGTPSDSLRCPRTHEGTLGSLGTLSAAGQLSAAAQDSSAGIGVHLTEGVAA